MMSIRPFGDRAILVEFDGTLSPDINGRARALAHHLRGMPGVVETVPALRSALIVIDPLRADRAALIDAAADAAHRLSPDFSGAGRVIEVPVRYGGEAGPDLEDIASLLHMDAGELIGLHTHGDYAVYMLGFAPGFPYLGLLPDLLRAPRLATPRVRVPSGSVAIADTLTGIYPLQTPGGWRIIGRTPLQIYDPRAADPILFRPGDRVRFVRVEAAQFPADRPVAWPTAPSHPVFEVLEPGLFTTVQDLGRHGYRSLGMPQSGAMDTEALRLANSLVGNAQGAAVLECTAPGPVLRALDDVAIAVTGADLTARLDGTEIEMWGSIRVRAGQVIRFGPPRQGMWAYIGLAGGIEAPTVLGSASAFVAGRVGGRLERGAIVGVRGGGTRSTGTRSPGTRSQLISRVRNGGAWLPAEKVTVRVIPGPQEQWFSADATDEFYSAVFRVTLQSDRAGIRLDGPVIGRDPKEMLSDPVLPGAIQVPPDGKPIVIMPDGPTTGGYPKIGVVATVDLPLLAQARPGTVVRFERTTVEAAVRALRARESLFEELRDKRDKGIKG